MKLICCIKLLFVLFTIKGFCQPTDNAELQKMYDEDQNSRTSGNIDWRTLSRQDSLRELRVNEMIKEGKIVTAKDYYNSAMIFQHDRDTVASSMAVKHMTKAIELDSTMNKWLLAAAIDRDLMRKGQPQIYGTQYVKELGEDKWKRYRIDSTKLSDEERKKYGVETLAEQKIKEYEMNLLSLSDYYAANTIQKTIELIKAEFKKKKDAEYNVSQIGLLIFAYELMGAEKNEDALQVHKLNTELYPDQYRPYYYYGECLQKVNRKQEARVAYQKALQLKPDLKQAMEKLKELE